MWGPPQRVHTESCRDLRGAGGGRQADGLFCSLRCPDITPAYITALKGGQKVQEIWSTAWPATLKLTTAATATQLWCCSRKVPAPPVCAPPPARPGARPASSSLPLLLPGIPHLGASRLGNPHGLAGHDTGKVGQDGAGGRPRPLRY